MTGTVYNDNGTGGGTAANGLQDAGEAGTNGGGLYALLLDGSSNVAASVAVAGNGSFSFSSIENGSYTVRLSTVAGTVGNAAPAESVPLGWVDTGESLTNAANDGVADGNLAVTVSGAAVSAMTLGMRQVADVLLDKNGPAVVTANGTVNYAMRVYSAGPAAANNAVFSDAVPSGLTGMTWTCVAAGGAACPNASGSGAISETIASFPAGGELTYSATGTAPASGSVTNSATVSTPAGLYDPNSGNNSDTVTTLIGTVGATADLAVVKTGPASVAANGALSYLVSVTNAGPAAANGATFSDAVPSGLSGMAWTCVGTGGAVCPNASGSGAISDTIATFPAGGSLVYTVSGTVTNSATVTAPGGVTDPDSSNNTDTASTLVSAMSGSADLAIAKLGPATVATGGAVSYTLLVSNAGPNAVTGASVVDAVPSVLSSVSWTCGSGTGGGSCASGSGSGNSINTTVNLPVGATVTLTVSGTAPAVGAFVNSAEVIPPVGTNDPDPGNDLGGPVITEVSTATLSGVVFNDNGAGAGTAADGVKNGTEPGLNPGSLNVVIVNAGNAVLAVAAVAGNGTWSAIVPTGSGYSAFITTANPSVGATLAPSATLPANWAVTGESSNGSSNDGTANGILTGINAGTSAGTFEFGIRSTLADMGVALSGLSSAGAPGATNVAGTVTYTNYGPAAAVNATCSASTVTSGASVAMGSCTASSGSAASLPVGATLTCPFTVTMPGTAGGSDTSATAVAISASTGATNEGGATSNSDSGSIPLIDAVDDPTATLGQAGGTVSVLGNDTVGSAAAVVGSNISAPTILLNGGLSGLSVNGSNQLAVPAATAANTYTVTYQICASPAATPAACDSASVDITVNASINPVTESGSVTAGTGGTAISNVASNDSVNGVAATLGGSGNATVATSGSWTSGITLDTATGAINVATTVAPGVYYETYQLCDKATPTPNCATVQDKITVNTVAVPPLANNDSATTNYGVAVTLPILANDAGGVDGAGVATTLDPATVDLDPATAGQQTSMTLTGMGTFTLNTTTGAVTFTPAAGFYGVASIPHTVQDNLSPTPQISNVALITVTVAPPPGAGTPVPPVANDDFATTPLNTPVNIAALTNDAGGVDSGGATTTLAEAAATVTLGTQPPASTGVFSVNGDGTVTFTPDSTFTGQATISYTVTDSAAQTSNSATITVIVSGGSTPVASPDAGSMKVTDASVTLAVLDNDVASNGAFLNPGTVDLDTGTAGIQNTLTTAEGTWTANADGTVAFTPASNYNSTGQPFTGTATLSYAVSDSAAQTAQSTITVIVIPVAVTAQNDSDSTAYDTSIMVDVAANDSAAPDATLDQSTVVLTGSGTGGVWTSNHDGTVTFNPDAGFTGPASVTYQISDSLGNVAAATLTITVGVSINPITESGSVVAGTGGTAIANVVSNDSVNGASATLGASGTATVAESGSWPVGISLDTTTGAVNVATTVAPGAYNVTYQLCDLATPTPNCATMLDTVTVTATINPVTESGGVVAGTGGAAIANVVANDSVNGASATLGAIGNATVAESGSWPAGITLDTSSGAINVAIAVTPGVYNVTYQLCDKATPTPNCATVQDMVTVNAAINPITESGSVTAGTGGTAISNVASNDSVNGAAATLGGGGNATVAQSGSWNSGITLDTSSGAINVAIAVTPGAYNVTYQLCDLATPTPNCATVQDTVTVNAAINPITESGSVTAGTGGTAISNVASNDSVNGVAATLGGGGNATVAESGSWTSGITLDTTTGAVNVATTVAPGVYNVTYQLCDKVGPNCATVQDAVTVNPPTVSTGSISGHVWYDTNNNNIFDSGELGRPGWTVELVLGGNVIATTTSAADGSYSFTGLADGNYSIIFSTIGTAGLTPVNGDGGAPVSSGGTASPSMLSNIVISGGNSVSGQSLPIDPSGRVYNSVSRKPIAGAVVTLLGSNGQPVSPGLVANGSNSVTTVADGSYALFLLPGAPAGPYSLRVSAAGYTFPSRLIPPSQGTWPAGGGSVGVSGVPTGAQSTLYYLSGPKPTSDLTNNNIPLDPSSSIPVPGIAGWGMIILSGLLVLVAIFALRRQQ